MRAVTRPGPDCLHWQYPLSPPRKRCSILCGRKLLCASNIDALQAAVRAALKSRQRQEHRIDLRKRRRDISGELTHLANTIAELGMVPTLMTRIRELESERIEIERRIETAPPAITDAIIPNLAARYRAALDDPPGTASRDIAAARQALQAVLGKVSVERADGATIARIRHAHAGISGVDNGGSGGRI